MNKSSLILFALFFLNLTLISASDPILLCLEKGQTVEFSECNSKMDDRTCDSEMGCKYCVFESDSGAYCPLVINQCNAANPSCTSLSNSPSPNPNPQNQTQNKTDPPNPPNQIITIDDTKDDNKEKDDEEDKDEENNYNFETISTSNNDQDENEIQTLAPNKNESKNDPSKKFFLFSFTAVMFLEFFVIAFFLNKGKKK